MPSRQGLFFIPDPCLISVFALLCPGLLLIKRRRNIGRIWGGAADKESICLTFFFLHAGLQTKGNLAVGNADKKGIAH